MTNDELYHYGVLGMKWGVRRFRDDTGPYTNKRVKKFDQRMSEYNKSKEHHKALKKDYKAGKVDKATYKKSKATVADNKRRLEITYGNLGVDRKADAGKALYDKGSSIKKNNRKSMISQLSVVAGSMAANKILEKTGVEPMRAKAISTAIAVGGTAVNAMIYAKTEAKNRNLRAYYLRD